MNEAQSNLFALPAVNFNSIGEWSVTLMEAHAYKRIKIDDQILFLDIHNKDHVFLQLFLSELNWQLGIARFHRYNQRHSLLQHLLHLS